MSEQTVKIRTASPEPIMCFYDAGNVEVARLEIKDGVLTFFGNADEAAKMLFEECLKPMWDNYTRMTLADNMARATLARS